MLLAAPVIATDAVPTLHDAAQMGASETCLRLLAEGADPDGRVDLPTSLGATDPTHTPGTSPLHLAAAQGHAQVCEILLAHSARLDSRDGLLSTPLHLAAATGSDPVCRLLINAGTSLGERDVGGETALHLAARGGHRSTCEMLLVAGADVNAIDLSGATPLHAAAAAHRAVVCSALLAAGAQVNQTDVTGHYPLHFAVHHALEPGAALSAAAETFLTLLRAGADDQAAFPLSQRSIIDALGDVPAAQERYLSIRSTIKADQLTSNWGGSVTSPGRTRF